MRQFYAVCQDRLKPVPACGNSICTTANSLRYFATESPTAYNPRQSLGIQLRRGHAEFSIAPFARLRRFGIPLHSKCPLNLSKESAVSSVLRRCHIRELRIHTALPVRVNWAESEQAINQIAYTLDVSRKGARLAGVTGLKGPGQLIVVRRNMGEARFRVVWIGRPRSPQEGQVGIECVEPDKTIWDIDFAKAQEDFESVGTASSGSAARPVDCSCSGTVKVWAEEFGSQCIEARLTAIGLSRCRIECATPLLRNCQLLFQLRIGETQLTIKGILHEEDVASGAWVEFTHIRRGDRRILQSLVVQLSRWKKDEIRNRPVEELCGPDHLCLFYSSREEQLAAVIPFLRAGLRRGERCIYIVDDDPAPLIDACRNAGILVDDVIAADALLVLTKWDSYLKRGDFDPEWMLQFLQDQVAAAKAAGFAALRVTGEVAWIDTKLDAARFLEYETKLNEVIPRIGLLGLCQYHRNRVGPEMIARILAIHPRIVESDGIHQNSTYRAV